METTVRQILDGKSARLVTIAPEQPVFEAISIMAEQGIGALPVMQDSKLVGIVTERDYARKVILKGRGSKETPVADIMTAEVICVSPDVKVDTCLQIMTEKRIRHLPVQRSGELCGIVSIGDLVSAVIADQAETIAQLENYISR